MAEQVATERSPEQRRQMSIILQAVGLFDVALGLAVAVFGPGLFDLDFLPFAIMGFALALGGIVIWWVARSRFGDPTGDRRSQPVVKRTR